MAENGSPGDLLLLHLDLIEQVVGSVCRRKGCHGEAAADFASWVRLRLMENDCAILRKFRGQCAIATYLTTVVHNLFRDYRTAEWGKWRPSAVALRRGPAAVELETLTSRDGYSFDEAIEILVSNLGSTTSRERLEELAEELPLRPRRRLESLDDVELAGHRPEAEDRVAEGELEIVQSRTEEALAEALDDLDGEDRLLLKMRYEDGFSVAEISKVLHIRQRALYSRFDRCLRRLRYALEGRGVHLDEVRELLSWGAPSLRVDYGWENLAEGPS
jgi:RNA polymerase sigma factor for flagellar operon FliA